MLRDASATVETQSAAARAHMTKTTRAGIRNKERLSLAEKMSSPTLCSRKGSAPAVAAIVVIAKAASKSVFHRGSKNSRMNRMKVVAPAPECASRFRLINIESQFGTPPPWRS